jgi:hypothetical protein
MPLSLGADLVLRLNRFKGLSAELGRIFNPDRRSD